MTVTAPLPPQRVGSKDPSKRSGRRASRRQPTAGWTGYLFVLPALAVFSLFVLRPLVQTFWLSFYTWNGLTPRKWAGLANYNALFTDPELRSAFAHAAFLIVFISLIPVGLGLLLATAISRARFRGMTFFRTVLFFPKSSPWSLSG